MTLKTKFIAAALTVVATGSASADTFAQAGGRYRIEPSSRIRFSVAQIAGGKIDGRFAAFSGVFDLKPQALARSRVVFQLRPDSVMTGAPRVDAFLRSSAVFDSAAFPVITFRSIDVARTGADSAAIHGLLTARGNTREETFTATLLGKEGRSASFHVVGDVLRSPYGMGVGTPIYSNVVKFDMIVRGGRGK